MIELVRAWLRWNNWYRKCDPSARAIRNQVAQSDIYAGRQHHGLVRPGDRLGEVSKSSRALQAEFRVATVARMLGGFPTGHSAWCRCEPSARTKSDQLLELRIRIIQARNRGASRRTHAVRADADPEKVQYADACTGSVVARRSPKIAFLMSSAEPGSGARRQDGDDSDSRITRRVSSSTPLQSVVPSRLARSALAAA